MDADIFERFLFEAPDDPPDMADTGPPDMPDGAAGEEGPPDMADGGDDAPPDMGGDEAPDMGDDFGVDGAEAQTQSQIDGLDEKVSAILNQQLYQKFLAMLNTIGNQLSQIKSNQDILYTLSPESLDIVDSLNKLDENIRLHLKNSFLDDNYSKNLLFFNKCLNLLKLLNDIFSEKIRKGIRSAE